jgi:CelD/BcsL family acetyltransferase involved in cellulose biosynthesis
MQFEVISDINQARRLWEEFSPHSEIDDEWEFRHTFMKYLDFPLRFVVASESGQPVGLLPLQFNTGKGPTPQSFAHQSDFLEFFGGDDTDNNRVWAKTGHEAAVAALLEQIREPAVLAPLAGPCEVRGKAAEVYTHKYTSDLSGMTGFADFLARHLDGKSRGKLAQKIARVERDAEVTIEDVGPEGLDGLFEYNQSRFGAASSFGWDYRKQVFRDLMSLYDHDVFRIMIDGEVKAVSFALIFKGWYLGMNIGYDYDVRDLGKFAAATQIERAIARGCTTYDSGKGDGGWKEQFHLSAHPQYMLALN